MAWYALYKWFIKFRKCSYTNWITEYRIYLYDKWYNSLSDEDKQKEDNRIKRIKENDELRTKQLFAFLSAINITYENLYYPPYY